MQNFDGVVAGSVVDKDYLEIVREAVGDFGERFVKRRESGGFVVDGDDDRDKLASWHSDLQIFLTAVFPWCSNELRSGKIAI